MAEKILQTRIQLKYDTLANWMSSTFILKAGEVAVATIANAATGSTGMTPPAIGIKVGDGSHKFSELNWIQAIAGDVPSWAKEANHTTIDNLISTAIQGVTDGLNVEDKQAVGKVELITAITMQNGKVKSYETTPIKTENVFLDDGTTTLKAKLSDIETAIAAAKSEAIAAAATDATSKANAAQAAAISAASADATTKADAAAASAISTAASDATAKVNAAKSALLGTATEGTDTIGTVKAAAATAQSKANEAATAAANASAKVDTEIGKLDYTDTADNTKFVSTVNEANGKISVTRVAVTDVLGIVDGYNKSTNKLVTVNHVNDTIGAVKNELLEEIGEMAGAMRFRGSVATDPTSSTQPSDDLGAFRAGDVLINSTSTKEFIYNGESWEELGSEGIYAIKSEVNTAIAGLESDVSGLDGRIDTLEADNTTNKSDIASLKSGKVDSATYTTTIDGINGKIATLETATGTTLPAAITKAQTDAQSYTDTKLGDLDFVDSQASGSGFVTSVTQTDGQINVAKSQIKVADISNIAYATGTSFSATNGFALKDYVDTAKKDAIDSIQPTINTSINNMGTATASNNSVITGVKIANGKLAVASEMAISAVGRTGNVNDLTQTAGDVLVFNCGSATVNI